MVCFKKKIKFWILESFVLLNKSYNTVYSRTSSGHFSREHFPT